MTTSPARSQETCPEAATTIEPLHTLSSIPQLLLRAIRLRNRKLSPWYSFRKSPLLPPSGDYRIIGASAWQANKYRGVHGHESSESEAAFVLPMTAHIAPLEPAVHHDCPIPQSGHDASRESHRRAW